MGFFDKLFGKNKSQGNSSDSKADKTDGSKDVVKPASGMENSPEEKPVSANPVDNNQFKSGSLTQNESSGYDNIDNPDTQKRLVRVFISSTFRDMIAERDKLMADVWPQLRKLCQERYVELVEVDMRWGITEAQSSQKETLKLCLDEIRDCRPFFIGLLGERYGWTPGEDSFTKDLLEEQKWLNEPNHKGKSVTELEIIHGVLRNPEMAGRAYFYFRDPVYSKDKGSDILSETQEDAEKQEALKNEIRKVCEEKHIPLKENYPDPDTLAKMVLDDLTAAIDAQYPKEDIPDQLTREAQGHEAFAAVRRKTYIGRNEYFDTLDRHVAADGGPLVLLGESGSGKSALLANWVAHWREKHPNDYIFQHYIGGTADSSDHFQMITRLIGEIKRWSDDPDDIPTDRDKLLRDFSLWLAKARAMAGKDGVRFIVVLDALNQLNDQDHALLLGWLPEHSFCGGPLRLIASTLPGKEGKDDPLKAVKDRGWQELIVNPLDTKERISLIEDYLLIFGKKLDSKRVEFLANASATQNPLYLKILLDDLRVTGTHEKLDERLSQYLKAADVPALLSQLFVRWQNAYENERELLVSDTLGLIYSSRRGLSESELLELLRRIETKEKKLPSSIWSPLRAVLNEFLIERKGVLNFSHDYFRLAVEKTIISNVKICGIYRLKLVDYFEDLPVTARSCDELPWLLNESLSYDRLREYLLGIEVFLEIYSRDKFELHCYWAKLDAKQEKGDLYYCNYISWYKQKKHSQKYISFCSYQLGLFLSESFHLQKAEMLLERSIEIDKNMLGKKHPEVACSLNVLAGICFFRQSYSKTEKYFKEAIAILEGNNNKFESSLISSLTGLATYYCFTNNFFEAEDLFKRGLIMSKYKYGEKHPNTAMILSNYSELCLFLGRLDDAEKMLSCSLEIFHKNLGGKHPLFGIALSSFGLINIIKGRYFEAEDSLNQSLGILRYVFGEEHPCTANVLVVIAILYLNTKREQKVKKIIDQSIKVFANNIGEGNILFSHCIIIIAETYCKMKYFSDAENLLNNYIEIVENIFGKDNLISVCGIRCQAFLYKEMERYQEAEDSFKSILKIQEKIFNDVQCIAYLKNYNHLAELLIETRKYCEAESYYKQLKLMYAKNYGVDHPGFAGCLKDLAFLYLKMTKYEEAEKLYNQAIVIYEKKLGKDCSEVADCLCGLSLLYHCMNKHEQSEVFCKKELSIRENNGKADEVVYCLKTYAFIVLLMGRYKEAESHYNRAMAIRVKELGPDHLDVADIHNDLAYLYMRMERYKEAESHYNRAMAIRVKELGPDHLDVADIHNDLAYLYMRMERYKEAESHYNRAMAIRVKELGPDHLDVADIHKDLAYLYMRMERYKEAESHYNRAMAIRVKELGPDHLDVADIHKDLAYLYMRIERYKEAESHYNRVMAIRVKELGPDHLDVANIHKDLAYLYMRIERYKEAESHYNRVMAIRVKELGPDHVDVADIHNDLAYLYMGMERYKEAESHYNRAMAIREKKLGPDHLDVAGIHNDLAYLYMRIERYKEAESHYNRVMAIRVKELGPDHVDVADIHNDLAYLYMGMERYKEAESHYNRAMAIRVKELGPDHLDVADIHNDLAYLYMRMERYKEAESHYNRVMAIRVKELGPDHLDVADIHNDLAYLYMRMERYKEAEPLYERVLAILAKFTRKTGQQHSNLMTSANNYFAILLKTGNSQEQATARIKKIVPELFGQKQRNPQEVIRSQALELFKQGEYTQAKKLYIKLLANNFEVQSTCLHLARIALMTDSLGEVIQYTEQAWSMRQEARAYVIARIIWLQLVNLLLEKDIEIMQKEKDMLQLLGKMKTVFSRDDSIVVWSMEPVLEHLKPKLEAKDHELLTALVAAMSNAEKIADLDKFEIWRKAKPVKID